MRKLFNKVKNFFTRKETRSFWLISAWAVESIVLFQSFGILLATGAIATASLLVAVQLYSTYALFSLILENRVI